MADELDQAETLAAQIDGLENDAIGQLLIRMIRQVRMLRVAVKNLDDRVKALEP